MHETMVAQSLLGMIVAEAEKHSAKPIIAKISCGALNDVNEEVLCFAFEAIGKGTVCEGMKLEVEHKPIQGRCKKCERSFDVDFSRMVCPECEGGDFELLADVPLVLETIELETE